MLGSDYGCMLGSDDSSDDGCRLDSDDGCMPGADDSCIFAQAIITFYFFVVPVLVVHVPLYRYFMYYCTIYCALLPSYPTTVVVGWSTVPSLQVLVPLYKKCPATAGTTNSYWYCTTSTSTYL